MGRVDGSVDPRFATVRDAFADVIARQPGTGAAVSAWHDGSPVVDLWGGWADAARTQPWQPDSIVMPYSVTKAFTAVCALLLVDRGRLDLDAPVSRYWPEFGTPATVRHVLSHQAGLVALDDPLPTEVFYDWDHLCRLLAGQESCWPPGTRHGESALFFGHLVGELVRRVDGRSLGSFQRDEVCGPLGLDFFVGLTGSEQHRAVDLTGLDERFATTSARERPALFGAALSNPPGALDADVVNGRRWRAAEIPAVNGHGTARAVAGLYAGLVQGRLLSARLLAEATSVVVSGLDAVLGSDNAWGLGFAVDDDGFGMGGLGGNLGWWSRDGGYAYGYVTGSVGDHQASDTLENVVRDCLGLAPL